MSRGTGKIFDKIFTIAVLAVFVAIVVLTLRLNAPLSEQYEQLKTKRAEAQAENLALKLRLGDLRTKQEKFAVDPDFVSGIARDNGWVYPDEVVFLFDTPESGRK